MDKQKVAHTYNETVFCLKEERNADTFYNMKLGDIMLSEINQTQNNKYCLVPVT